MRRITFIFYIYLFIYSLMFTSVRVKDARSEGLAKGSVRRIEDCIQIKLTFLFFFFSSTFLSFFSDGDLG